MLRTLKKYWAAVFLIIVLLSVPVSMVQARIVPDCTVINNDGELVKPCGFSDLLQLLGNIYNLLLSLAAFVAMLAIIIGGLRMIVHSLIESPEQELQAAKYTVTRAVSGMIIVVMAYLIVNTIISLIGGGGLGDVIGRLTDPFGG